MLEDFDKDISVIMESLARMLSRRKMIGNLVRGLTVAITATTVGQITNVGQAFAHALDCTCTCDDCWTNGQPCQYCPASANCPSGCTVCTSSDWCGGWCDYSNGRWVSYNCNKLGNCQVGYKMCTDCKCPDCNHKCTCLSACICCSCCTPADVKAEMQRLALSA